MTADDPQDRCGNFGGVVVAGLRHVGCDLTCESHSDAFVGRFHRFMRHEHCCNLMLETMETQKIQVAFSIYKQRPAMMITHHGIYFIVILMLQLKFKNTYH